MRKNITFIELTIVIIGIIFLGKLCIFSKDPQSGNTVIQSHISQPVIKKNHTVKAQGCINLPGNTDYTPAPIVYKCPKCKSKDIKLIALDYMIGDKTAPPSYGECNKCGYKYTLANFKY